MQRCRGVDRIRKSQPCLRPQLRGDAVDASTVEQAHGRIPQERHDRRSLPNMNQAGILTEGDVFAAMQAILDAPVAAPQCQQSRRSTI